MKKAKRDWRNLLEIRNNRGRVREHNIIMNGVAEITRCILELYVKFENPLLHLGASFDEVKDETGELTKSAEDTMILQERWCIKSLLGIGQNNWNRNFRRKIVCSPDLLSSFHDSKEVVLVGRIIQGMCEI